MKNLTKFGIVALLLVSLAGSAFAFSGRGFGNEETKQAIESGDYKAWKEAMVSQLTEERFNQMKENHNQMAEKKAGMQEQRESVEAAIEAEDYDAWVLAVETCPRENKFAETVTEENFKTFVAMHNAMQDKDFETVKSLAEELGLEDGMGRNLNKSGKGMFGARMHIE